jgi:hypothetical protein
MIGLVFDFNEKFELPLGDEDILTGNKAAYDFRRRFMQEELDEFQRCFEAGSRVGMFDALLDLSYVIYGTALFMGVSPDQWTAGMNTIHQCNMKKIRVAKDSTETVGSSKRRSAFDVKKPAGWIGPEENLKSILDYDHMEKGYSDEG